MTGLRSRDEVRPVVIALKGQSSLPLIQPEAFADPLAKFVMRSDDPEGLLLAFEGLAVLLDPKSWASRVTSKANTYDRSERLPLLALIVSPETIASREHRARLLPIVMSTLEDQVAAVTAKKWRDQPDLDLLNGAMLMTFLATERHEAAIPMMEQLVRESATDDKPFLLAQMGWMGEPALAALDRLMSSPRMGVRLSAISIVPDFLGAGAQLPKELRLTDVERSRIAKRLRSDFLSRIEKSLEDDSLPNWARKKARRAIDAIEVSERQPSGE
jgi:hypothetical protein